MIVIAELALVDKLGKQSSRTDVHWTLSDLDFEVLTYEFMLNRQDPQGSI